MDTTFVKHERYTHSQVNVRIQPKIADENKSDHVDPSEVRTGLMGGPAGTCSGCKPLRDAKTSLE